MAEPKPAVSFAETVYALSQVIHVVKFRNDISGGLTKDQRKHLCLLNDIALLLVTESNCDVAAVSLERVPSGVHFYYAKNRPEAAKDKEHIEALWKLVRGTGDETERIDKILRHVKIHCGPKLLSRFRKLKAKILINQDTPGGYLRGDQNGELHDYYKSNFTDWYDKYLTATDLLTDFLSAIVLWVPDANDSDGLLELLRMAHVTGFFKQDSSPVTAISNQRDDPIFLDRDLGQRLRLFGDYYGAAKRIVKHYDFAAAKQSKEITIDFIPVPVSPQQEVAMPKDYLKILNRFAADRNLPEVTYQTLAKAHPNRTDRPTPGGKGSQPVIQSVHAECSLAVYLTSLGRSWTNIEIGCSKGSCWLCESYLRCNQAGLAFHVRNVHGKLQPGWTIPEGTDAVVEKYMHMLVENELVEVLHKAHHTKRADSEPRSDSDEEGNKKAPQLIGKPSWARS